MTVVAETALFQPAWDDQDVLDSVLEDLRERQPLVDPASCLALRDELGSVADGSAFLLQAGDCAERFTDSGASRILAKASLLHDLADQFESTVGTPVVRVGRLAGQYAKPRTCQTEALADGTVVPTYRGDAVNSPEPTLAARRSDPRRLLHAYDASAQALQSLRVDQVPPTSGVDGLAPTYVSHEALLLDYERALTVDREDVTFGASAHLLWIGDRTRQLDGGHLRFATTVANPVGVKIGPSASPTEVHAIAERLTECHPAGRLTLITRLGADRAGDLLTDIVDAVGDLRTQVVWACDPMHGNTVVTRSGRKTRVVEDIIREVEQSVQALHDRGAILGGLHLEITPDAVTECLQSPADLAGDALLPRYETACDPRLSPAQAELVVQETARLVAAAHP
jgi:3-deoxy-7-phosphoheptulonate synthase